MQEPVYHTPVLLEKSIELLDIKREGIYVDVTFGGGGHSREILKRLGEKGRLVVFDRDEEALANAPIDERLTCILSDYQFIERELVSSGIQSVDGILADLGVSSHQFDTAERGFSFRFDGPLDMRMGQQELHAANVLNEYEEEELVRIFREYGEIQNAKKLVRIILETRKREEISQTQQFSTIIESCIPPKRKSKYLAQVYQALRIEVNQELSSLQHLLESSEKLLNPAGRLVVIAYHSLEDRMVKRFMRSGNIAGLLARDFYGNPLSPWDQITRKAIQADSQEIEQNPRARSARLRAVEKK
ncbi:MAG: 16S rRNA (cytosine(1402)-N(4))-methyltransferase RsmH [Bacteroidota bacterium]